MRTVKFGVIGLVVIGLLIAIYFLFGNYSDGTRAGTIVKLSNKGYFFKTLEGQLNLGGLTQESGSPASSLWDFSVSSNDAQLIKDLEDANLNGRRIKLYYKEKYYTLPWRGDTKYFIYKVEKSN